jgi:hypothetical protein
VFPAAFIFDALSIAELRVIGRVDARNFFRRDTVVSREEYLRFAAECQAIAETVTDPSSKGPATRDGGGVAKACGSSSAAPTPGTTLRIADSLDKAKSRCSGSRTRRTNIRKLKGGPSQSKLQP